MRPIHLARMDKTRPVLVLTREIARPRLTRVTVATITGTARGLTTEVAVGKQNGLDHDCAVSCDNVQTIHVDQLGAFVGYLLPEQEPALAEAIVHAFDLEW
jgi:mRNA interferase MazF